MFGCGWLEDLWSNGPGLMLIRGLNFDGAGERHEDEVVRERPEGSKINGN